MRHELLRFGALLGKEMREHRNLFGNTPIVFALLLTLIFVLTILALPLDLEQTLTRQAAELLANLPMRSAVIIPVLLSVPFALALLLNLIIYLTVCLYQDRKDRSFLFWQSMPVSDWQTVLSRVVTSVFVVPAYTTLGALVWLMAPMIYLAPALSEADVTFAFGKSLLLALDGAVLFYCFAWLNGLLLMPIIGWMLLFSAYSRRVPFLWATGSAIVLILLEITLLDSLYFGNWINWTVKAGVFGYSDILATLFSYEMLAALMLGGVLLAGATLMRRFND